MNRKIGINDFFSQAREKLLAFSCACDLKNTNAQVARTGDSRAGFIAVHDVERVVRIRDLEPWWRWRASLL